MRIKLRPYHVTGILTFIGSGPRRNHFNGANEIAEKIKQNPELEIEVTDRFDDICAQCRRRVRDENGCVWGPDYSCDSARDPDIVEQVAAENRKILDALGIDCGAVLQAREWLELVARNIDDIGDYPNTGGRDEQGNFEKGIEVLREIHRDWMARRAP